MPIQSKDSLLVELVTSNAQIRGKNGAGIVKIRNSSFCINDAQGKHKSTCWTSEGQEPDFRGLYLF